MVAILAAVVLRPVMVYFLGIAHYGIFVLASTVLGIMSLVLDLGFGSALIRFLAEENNPQRRSELVTTGIVASLGTGALSGGGLFILAPVIASIFSMPLLTPLLTIMALQLPFTLAALTCLSAINGLRWMRVYGLGAAFINLSSFGLVTGVLVFGGDVLTVAVAVLSSSILSFVVLVAVLREYLSVKALLAFRPTSRELIGFGIQMSATNGTSTLLYTTDIILLGLFTKSEVVVGHYSLATLLARMLWIIPGSFSIVAYPAISAYSKEGSRSQTEGLVDRALRFSTGTVGFLVLVFAYFGTDALSMLFGFDGIPAYMPLLIMLPGAAMLGVMKAVASGLAGVGRPDLGLKISLVGLATSVSLNMILIPILGLLGVALGTSLSYGLIAVLLFRTLAKLIGMRLDIRWFLRIAGIVAALAAPLLGAGILPGASDLMRWVIGAAALGTYVGLLYSRLLAREDTRFLFETLRAAIRGPLPP